jgi:pyridoxine/pyridoxamine 5'-phosphate oxidase
MKRRYCEFHQLHHQCHLAKFSRRDRMSEKIAWASRGRPIEHRTKRKTETSKINQYYSRKSTVLSKFWFCASLSNEERRFLFTVYYRKNLFLSLNDL